MNIEGRLDGKDGIAVFESSAAIDCSAKVEQFKESRLFPMNRRKYRDDEHADPVHASVEATSVSDAITRRRDG